MQAGSESTLTAPQQPEILKTNPEIENLRNSLTSLKVVHSTIKVLNSGTFHHSLLEGVRSGMSFLQTLYTQLRDDCVASPHINEFPELVQLKKDMEKNLEKSKKE